MMYLLEDVPLVEFIMYDVFTRGCTSGGVYNVPCIYSDDR